jgi:uncharacterized membrane protein YkgB
MSTFDQLLIPPIRTGRLGTNLVRISIAIVLIWIGLLEFMPFEADSITPMVARSLVMSFFYKYPEQYKEHMTQEGQLVPAARAWQEETIRIDSRAGSAASNCSSPSSSCSICFRERRVSLMGSCRS